MDNKKKKLLTTATWIALVAILFVGGITTSEGARARRTLADRHQVCIWGAGASGMFAAVSLADAGYTDILVLDPLNHVGGQCNTIRTDTTWEEAGVMVYPDTAAANRAGFGPWNIDTVAIIKRFAGDDAIIPTYFTDVPSYVAWADSGLLLAGPILGSTFTPEQQEAMDRLKNIMATRLLWMDTLENIPKPIPEELTLTLSQWVDANNLTAIKDVFFASRYFYAGLGNIDQITAFDGLMQRTATDLLYDDPLHPGLWFSVKNGCKSIYDGMKSYLGENSFRLGATIDSIQRPRNNRSARPIVINGKQNGVPFVERCDHLIVSVPQSLDNLAPMDLSNEELSLFSTVKSKYYFTGYMNAKGALGDHLNTGHLMLNVDPTKPSTRPTLPNLLITFRKFATGPIIYQSFSQDPITRDQMNLISSDVLAKLSQGGIYTNITRVAQWRHQFNPTWSADVLSGDTPPQYRLDDLNGNRKTFYIGSLRSTANTMVIWHHTKKVIDHFFVEDNSDNEEDTDHHSYTRSESVSQDQEEKAAIQSSDSSRVCSALFGHLEAAIF